MFNKQVTVSQATSILLLVPYCCMNLPNLFRRHYGLDAAAHDFNSSPRRLTLMEPGLGIAHDTVSHKRRFEYGVRVIQ